MRWTFVATAGRRMHGRGISDLRPKISFLKCPSILRLPEYPSLPQPNCPLPSGNQRVLILVQNCLLYISLMWQTLKLPPYISLIQMFVLEITRQIVLPQVQYWRLWSWIPENLSWSLLRYGADSKTPGELRPLDTNYGCCDRNCQSPFLLSSRLSNAQCCRLNWSVFLVTKKAQEKS